ncbi:TolB-like translocation protein [Algoriphagus namhaensis]
MVKNAFVTLLLLTFTLSLFAQQGPDLFSVPVSGKGSSIRLNPQSLKQLTDRKEYDSQPSFINEYQMVFSAADENGNHDIIVYNFETEKFTNLSKTDDRGEFSPSITDCGQYIAAVVMEPDQRQRLWLYPTNFEPAELLYDDLEPVGYYDWYDNKAAMFILGEPNKLIYANGRDDAWELDTNIGRSVKKRPKSAEIAYLSNSKRSEEGSAALMLFDLKKKTKTQIGYALQGSLDFIWLDKKHVIMARGNEIFVRNMNSTDWKSVGIIPIETHQNITRMAYSPDLNLLVFAMERK